jgi:hypothetical protein
MDQLKLQLEKEETVAHDNHTLLVDENEKLRLNLEQSQKLIEQAN